MRDSTPSEAFFGRWERRIAGMALMVFLLPVPWGMAQELSTEYGKRRGEGRTSLNGMSGFAALWESQGSVVQSADRLTPRLDRFDVVVWCPAGRRPIDPSERERLERWLTQRDGRTLIVVLRDYDAQRDYLEATLPQVSADSRAAWRRKISQAAAEDLSQRMQFPEPRLEGWVDVETPLGRRQALRLSGSLSEGIEVASTHVVLDRPLAVPNLKSQSLPLDLEFDVLMRADGHPFVIEVWNLPTSAGINDSEDSEWDGDGIGEMHGGSHILMVANSSFLGNYGMTFPGNRQLAERLMAQASSRDRVLFLESGESTLEISDRESRETPTMWDWMAEWPFAFVMPHLLALGVLTYFVHLPVFGRPRRESRRSKTDFGRHVEAIGELLERTHDRGFVDRHLKQYHELVRRESTGLGMRSESARVREENRTEEKR